MLIAWMMFNVITLSVLYSVITLVQLLGLLALNAFAAVVGAPLLARIANGEARRATARLLLRRTRR